MRVFLIIDVERKSSRRKDKKSRKHKKSKNKKSRKGSSSDNSESESEDDVMSNILWSEKKGNPVIHRTLSAWETRGRESITY